MKSTNHTKSNREEELREEFINLCDESASRSGTELTMRSINQIADFWLSKLSSERKHERKKVVEEVLNVIYKRMLSDGGDEFSQAGMRDAYKLALAHQREWVEATAKEYGVTLTNKEE